MIWKTYYFKGAEISKQDADYTIWLTKVLWRNVSTSDTSRDVLGYHGIKLSPTFARWRTIEIEGIIDANNRAWLSKWMDYLDVLFSLETLPDTLVTYEFSVQDEQDRWWTIQAKIKEKIEYEINEDYDHIDWAYRTFRAVLQAESSWFTSSIEQVVTWSESVFWGTEMWFELEVAFDDIYNAINASSNWNLEAPCVIEMDISWSLDSPLYIKNSDWTFFWLDITATIGDIIMVNSVEKTATKNGVNILASRIAWSIRPKVGKDTTFVIYDVDQALESSDFNVTITFNDILL